jgi:hypothetical protein
VFDVFRYPRFPWERHAAIFSVAFSALRICRTSHGSASARAAAAMVENKNSPTGLRFFSG